MSKLMDMKEMQIVPKSTIQAKWFADEVFRYTKVNNDRVIKLVLYQMIDLKHMILKWKEIFVIIACPQLASWSMISNDFAGLHA